MTPFQEGTYDSGTTSWKVPVAGLGGFSGGVLQLGGILNPSEMRDMLNGGVKEPGPPFHQFAVQLKRMLHIEDEKETKESRRRMRRRVVLIWRRVIWILICSSFIKWRWFGIQFNQI